MLVVFVLLAIGIAFYVISKNIKANKALLVELNKNKQSNELKTDNPEGTSAKKTDEEVAAFLALHLYLTQNLHDKESNVLTIDRIQRRYSPWSSKIYSMNNFQ
ncbi:MAG: hypothetical protein ACK5KP_06600 [Paludibacteraceae bacterium]